MPFCSIDDQEKFDLLAFKNSKYLFYRFNDFIKVYENPRYRLLHTKKMLDCVGIKKIEEKNGGDSDEFVKALEFIGLSTINREFSAFLLSDLGRKTMTQNKLSIHVESGDIFYDNHTTGENFYSFLFSQQNDEAAYIP